MDVCLNANGFALIMPVRQTGSLRLIGAVLTGNPTGMKVKRAGPGGEGLVLDPYSTEALVRYLQQPEVASEPVGMRAAVAI